MASYIYILLSAYLIFCDTPSVVCSYSIMQECWNDDKESRPTFLDLKKEFDGLISQEERYNYLSLDLDLAAEGPAPPVEGEASISSHIMQEEVEITHADTDPPV